MTDELIQRLRDLLVQATKERSHFYVARCTRDAINEIERLRASEAYMASKLEQTLVIEGELRQRIAELEQIIAKWYEYWPEPWAEGLDGFEMQEFGVKHGILERLERTVPCEENCNCAEYYGHGETAICYRLKPEFLKALKEG